MDAGRWFLGTFLTTGTPGSTRSEKMFSLLAFQSSCTEGSIPGSPQLGPKEGPVEPTDAAAQTLSGCYLGDDTVTPRAEDRNPELTLKHKDSKYNKIGTGHSQFTKTHKGVCDSPVVR